MIYKLVLRNVTWIAFVNPILWILIVHLQITFCEYGLGYGFVNGCLQWMWICSCICESYFLGRKTPYVCAEWEVCANALNLQEFLLLICVAQRWVRWKSNEKWRLITNPPSSVHSHDNIFILALCFHSIQTDEIVCHYLLTLMQNCMLLFVLFLAALFCQMKELCEQQTEFWIFICS